MREWRLSAGLLMEGLYRAEMRLHLKPYWGKPNVRNFRELAGNMRAKILIPCMTYKAGTPVLRQLATQRLTKW